MPKVSVIMPVHNSEQYLREAISSVLEQSYTDLELIVIDDASTDSSIEICKQFAEGDERVVVLENTTDHNGCGATRNVGLDHARGDYIYFVDSDDWIDPELIECAVESIEKDNADIVEFGYFIEKYDPARSTTEKAIAFSGVLTKQYIEDNICEFWRKRELTVWQHMFRKETVKDNRFERITVGEDASFVMDAFVNADRISCIQSNHYHYRIVAGSTYYKWNELIFDNTFVQWKHENAFLDSLNHKLSDKEYGEIVCSFYIRMIYELCLPWCPLTLKQKKDKLEYIKKNLNVDADRKNFKNHNKSSLEVSASYIFVKLRMEMLLIALASSYFKIFHKNMIRVF